MKQIKTKRRHVSHIRGIATEPKSTVELKPILAKEGIKEFAEDIRTMSKSELIRNFSYKKTLNEKLSRCGLRI